MNPESAASLAPTVGTTRSGLAAVALALVPLLLLAGLLTFIVRMGPAGLGGGPTPPPVERLVVTRAELSPDRIELSLFNDGPDAVTIAQVAVDDAFWTFEMSPGRTLDHLGRGKVSIPYPWVHGEAHVVRLMTSTGVTFDHTIPVAVESPRPSLGQLGTFALVGLYVGVVPVALGLLWYPLLGRIGARGMQFLMALTIGLLGYLLVDATHDGLESAGALPGSLQGPALFVFAALAAYVVLDAVGSWLGGRRGTSNPSIHSSGQSARPADSGTWPLFKALPADRAPLALATQVNSGTNAAARSPGGWVLAVLIAIGIGLHNFGEGLAIGSAFALGELALGTLLIVGFTLHNTTEGLAIIAPLARQQAGAPRVGVGRLVQLGLIGGAPTIAGAWLGAFAQSPALAVIFLALGVGGIAQVTRQIVVHSASEHGVAQYFRAPHVVSGLAAGVALMYLTGMVVG